MTGNLGLPINRGIVAVIAWVLMFSVMSALAVAAEGQITLDWNSIIGDTYVSDAALPSDDADTVHGTEGALLIKEGLRANGKSGCSDIMVSWNLVGLPAGAQVINASMGLYLTDNMLSSKTIDSLTFATGRKDASWDETTATGNNQPAEFCYDDGSGCVNKYDASLTITSADPTATRYWFPFTVHVKDAIEKGTSSVTLLIDCNQASSSNPMTERLMFSSKENSDSNNRPVLSIAYTLPSTTALSMKQEAAQMLMDLGLNNRNERKAYEFIVMSTDDFFWTDGDHISTMFGHMVFNLERKAVKHLERECRPTKKHYVGSERCVSLVQVMQKLAAADERLAQTAIDDAIAAGGNAGKLNKADKQMNKGDAAVANGKYDDAIKYYRKAWKHAMKAINVDVSEKGDWEPDDD